MAQLRVIAPDRSERVVALEGHSCSIGRAPLNDLCYPGDRTLARKHFRLEAREHSWIVTDCGTGSGTLINGDRLSETRALVHGDRIQAGRLTFVYYEGC